MREIDGRGLACPAPVLKAKSAVEEGITRLRVIVDNGGAQENVRLFLESRGFTVELSRDVSDFIVMANRGTSFSGPIPDSAIPPCPPARRRAGIPERGFPADHGPGLLGPHGPGG